MKYSTLKYATFELTPKGVKVLRESDRYADTDRRSTFGPIAREILAEADRSEAAGEAGRASKVIEALLNDESYRPNLKPFREGDRNGKIRKINEYINSVAGEAGEGLITVPE